MKLFCTTYLRLSWKTQLLLSGLLGVQGLPTASAAWNPDAGLVTSITTGASLSATSPGSNLNWVLDGNTDTSWQSGACLPTGYIARQELNQVLGVCALGRCSSSGSTNMKDATDNDPYTGAYVPASNGTAWINVPLPQTRALYQLGVRGFGNQPIAFEAVTASGNKLVSTLTTADNYQYRRFTSPADPITALRVSSKDKFTLTEISTLAEPCFEAVTVDLGSSRDVGWIQMKHWSPDATATTLSISNDGQKWSQVASLIPTSLAFQSTRFTAQPTRYIKVRHNVVERDWAKVYVWDIAAYDANGPYGAAAPAKANPHTMAELLGINGIWSWGNNPTGAVLYRQVASHARNYHNLSWDVTDPDHIPDYTKMATGKGTEAQWWLNWDLEYAGWVKAGLEVETSIQFTNSNFPVAVWNNPNLAGYNYGFAFAQHFGPSFGNGLVRALEVGNEPWDYPASFYRTVLGGMAAGVKAGDPTMKVMPGALQAIRPEAANAIGGNYIGARLTPVEAANIDVLNTHAYSYSFSANGKRIAVPPENADSTMNEVRNFLRFRDANLPAMPVYFTEWGWDSAGVGENCNASECVSERAQALYAVRGALVLSRLGLDRLTWFFYANDKACDTLYCRSGLTSSFNTGFKPKQSFRAFQAMLSTLGNRYFLTALREDSTAYVYLLGDKTGKATHLVAWRPVGGDDITLSDLTLPVNAMPASATALSGTTATGELVALPAVANGQWTMKLSSVPLVVTFK
jgi:hypothetical protein